MEQRPCAQDGRAGSPGALRGATRAITVRTKDIIHRPFLQCVNATKVNESTYIVLFVKDRPSGYLERILSHLLHPPRPSPT